jgi:hypothetical protein
LVILKNRNITGESPGNINNTGSNDRLPPLKAEAVSGNFHLGPLFCVVYDAFSCRYQVPSGSFDHIEDFLGSLHLGSHFVNPEQAC